MARALSTSDRDLVVALREGDPESLSELYERHFHALYDFAARILRDHRDAADVTRDAFVHVLTEDQLVPDPGRFRASLFRCAHRLAAACVTRGRLAHGVDGPEAAISHFALCDTEGDAPRDVDEAASQRVEAGLVWGLAESLDLDSYAVLDLKVRRGFTIPEIGEILGVATDTVSRTVDEIETRLAGSVRTYRTYLLANAGAEECPGLARLVAKVEIPPMTSDIEHTIDRHVSGCGTCASARRELLDPLRVFASLASVPVSSDLNAAIRQAIRRGMSHRSDSAPASAGVLGSAFFRAAAAAVVLALLGGAWVLLNGSESSPTTPSILSAGMAQDAIVAGNAVPSTTRVDSTLPRTTTTIIVTTTTLPATTTTAPTTTTTLPTTLGLVDGSSTRTTAAATTTTTVPAVATSRTASVGTPSVRATTTTTVPATTTTVPATTTSVPPTTVPATTTPPTTIPVTTTTAWTLPTTTTLPPPGSDLPPGWSPQP